MSPTLESDLALIFQPQNSDTDVHFEFYCYRTRLSRNHNSEWCRNDQQNIFVLALNWHKHTIMLEIVFFNY